MRGRGRARLTMRPSHVCMAEAPRWPGQIPVDTPGIGSWRGRGRGRGRCPCARALAVGTPSRALAGQSNSNTARARARAAPTKQPLASAATTGTDGCMGPWAPHGGAAAGFRIPSSASASTEQRGPLRDSLRHSFFALNLPSAGCFLSCVFVSCSCMHLHSALPLLLLPPSFVVTARTNSAGRTHPASASTHQATTARGSRKVLCFLGSRPCDIREFGSSSFLLLIKYTSFSCNATLFN
jgi:hypothetical protein